MFAERTLSSYPISEFDSKIVVMSLSLLWLLKLLVPSSTCVATCRIENKQGKLTLASECVTWLRSHMISLATVYTGSGCIKGEVLPVIFTIVLIVANHTTLSLSVAKLKTSWHWVSLVLRCFSTFTKIKLN